jgi:hypothetical protein
MIGRTPLPAILALLVLAAFVPATVRAGSSVGFIEDAVPFLKKDPSLLELITKTLDIEDIGWAREGGRTFNKPEGDRTLPYGFRAKPKNQPGPYTILVLVEANSSGKGVILTIVPLDHGSDPNPVQPQQ